MKKLEELYNLYSSQLTDWFTTHINYCKNICEHSDYKEGVDFFNNFSLNTSNSYTLDDLCSLLLNTNNRNIDRNKVSMLAKICVPDKNDFIKGLQALISAGAEIEGSVVKCKIKNVIIEDVELGDYECVLDFNDVISNISDRTRINYLGEKCNVLDPDVTHPNIRHNFLCRGSSDKILIQHALQGNIFEYVLLVNNIVHTYGVGSPYSFIRAWKAEGGCTDCGEALGAGEAISCDECQNLSCTSCSVFCNCGEDLCHECAVSCESCQSHMCFRCSYSCNNCYSDYCSDCLHWCESCQSHLCHNCGNFTECNVCNSYICGGCQVTCDICSNISCESCTSYCDHCNIDICDNCSVQCANCNNIGCANCISYCESCSEPFCNKCLFGGLCDGCSEECECGNPDCQKIQVTCSCGAETCDGNIQKCELCSCFLCDECKEKCDNCLKVVCDDHLTFANRKFLCEDCYGNKQ